MKRNTQKELVCVTPKDDKYIEELYKKIVAEYNKQAAIAGIKTTGINWKGYTGPKITHIVSFLREHSVFDDKDIKKFAAKFIDIQS